MSRWVEENKRGIRQKSVFEKNSTTLFGKNEILFSVYYDYIGNLFNLVRGTRIGSLLIACNSREFIRK